MNQMIMNGTLKTSANEEKIIYNEHLFRAKEVKTILQNQAIAG